MSWQTDFRLEGYLSPAETAEARIDPDQEQDNARDDWAEGWR